VSVPIRARHLRALAAERRALHSEGLLAVAATVGLVAVAIVGVPVRAAAPVALMYGAMLFSWLTRYFGLLGRSCPRCGDQFFYSMERLLYSLPYLSRHCAHCDASLEESRTGRS
jgi:hypothetical protein